MTRVHSIAFLIEPLNFVFISGLLVGDVTTDIAWIVNRWP